MQSAVLAQLEPIQDIENLRMHYAIEDITDSALFGVILIITDKQEFHRGEVCPNGVSSVSVWA
jgi:hypothetical protein